MSCFVKILFLMQIFSDPRKYAGKGHIEGLLRPVENANAHLIGWPISCAGHMYTRRYYRVSHWLKNQRENIGKIAKVSREWFAVSIG